MIPDTAIIGPAESMGAEAIPLPAVPSGVPSLDQDREYIRVSKAENTLRGYQSDWYCPAGLVRLSFRQAGSQGPHPPANHAEDGLAERAD
jgi:hypothetical protein